jgi:hypothetical protein
VGGACDRYGRGEKRVKDLVGEPERKRPLGRPTGRWEDGIKMDLRDTGWEVLEWIHVAHYRK